MEYLTTTTDLVLICAFGIAVGYPLAIVRTLLKK